MYPEQAKNAVGIEIRQTELSSVNSQFLDVNERTEKYLSEIAESLNKIYPIQEPSEKNPEPTSKPEMPSVINSLRAQLRYANQNADKLQVIARHLNTLV